MYKQVNELISLLESEGKCEVKLINREDHTYQIDSLSGLAWQQRSSTFGRMHAEEKRLELELDFPVHSFTAEELKHATGLPLQEKSAQEFSSYIHPTFNKASYDSVKVVIHHSDVMDYSFQDENFVSWINKLIRLNVK